MSLEDDRPRLRIARVTEADFDRLITGAGGTRWNADAAVETTPNPDYELGNAILELKLIEEEGLLGRQKGQRQRKLAELFRRTQPDHPVVVLDSASLDAEAERRYFDILAGPIQTAVKKAAQQLERTRTGRRPESIRVLIVINNGYAALSHDEFVRIVLKSVRNDTRNIDSVVIGGVYYYTDEFDSYTLFPFEEHPIDVSRRLRSFEILRAQWSEFANEVMTEASRGTSQRFEKMPVVDIAFDVDSTTFIKPAPKMGATSQFWVSGRPRRNSTGLTVCPPVGRTLPDFEHEEWRRFRVALPASSFLRPSYAEWRRFRDEELAIAGEETEPIVPVLMSCDAFIDWCRRSGAPPGEREMFAYAVHIFDEAVRALALSARAISETSVLPARYMLVQTNEIGQDKAYDFSSIAMVQENVGARQIVNVVSFKRIFYEHALVLAAAYAFKHDVEVILSERVQTYAWV
jgi:hypothetical protein